jgi:hypothetical protein
MTVFRVDVDKDEAQVVPPSTAKEWYIHVGLNKNGRVQSLSEISMQQFGTFKLWPLIWYLNYSVVPDPNKVKHKQLLFVPRRNAVSPREVNEAALIFNMWRDVKKAKEMLTKWLDRDVAAGREVNDRTAAIYPEWMWWGNRKKDWERWSGQK